MKKILLIIFFLFFPASLLAQNSARMISGTNIITCATPYTIQASDVTKLDVFTGTAACSVSLPSATTSGFGKGSIFSVKNNSAAFSVTITTTAGTIDGSPSLTLAPNQGADIYSDGINYETQPGKGGGGGGTSNYQTIQDQSTTLPPRPTLKFPTISCADDSGNTSTDCTINYQTIQTGGVSVPVEKKLNFPSGVTCVDNSGNSSTDCTPSSTSYQIIQNNASSLPSEPKWNAVPPFTCVDNSGNTRTDCSVPVAIGVGGSHATGLVPDPGASGTSTDYLGRDMAYHTSVSAATVKPDPSFGAQYVSALCNGGGACSDNNDGLSAGSAKLTIYGALLALPGGGSGVAGAGTIYIGNGVTSNPTSGAGIWLMGCGGSAPDPNCGAPPTGWLKCLGPGQSCPVNFIGISNNEYGPNGHKPKVQVLGGNNTDNNHPAVWLSSTSNEWFENINFDGSLGRPIVVGECSNNVRTGSCAVTNIAFDNDSSSASGSASSGPCMDITGASFWITLTDFGCSGNSTNATGGSTANNAAAILVDGTSNTGNGLIHMTNISLASGGVKVIPGTNGGAVYIKDLIEEGDFTHAIPPAVWFTSFGIQTDCYAMNIQVADANPSLPAPVVQNDGNGPGCTVINTQAGIIKGPNTVVNGDNHQLINQTVTPQNSSQVGFFNGYMIGETDVARRLNGLTSARIANIASSNSNNWTVTQFSGTSTLTQNISDPFGGTGAATATSNNAATENLYLSPGGGSCTIAYTPTAGDWLVTAGWIQTTVMFTTPAITLNYCSFPTPTFSKTYNNVGINQGDGHWAYVWTANKVSGGSATHLGSASTFSSTQSMTVYGPILFVIPSGTFTDDEVLDYVTSMNSYDTACAVGSICNVAGHPVSVDTLNLRFSTFTGSLVPGTLTGNRTYTFPDASGTVPLFTGTITASGNVCASGTAGLITTVGCIGGGGSGTILPAAQFSMTYYDQVGSAAHVSGSPSSTGPNGVFNYCGETPTGGAPTVPACNGLAGILFRGIAINSDNVLATDRGSRLVYSNGATNAVGIPDPGTPGGFTNGFAFKAKAITGSNVTTFTPTTKLCNGAANCQILQGQDATFTTDGSNYFADIHDPPITSCVGCTITRGDYGITLTNTTSAGNMQTNAANTMGASGTIDGSAMATTAGFKTPVGAGAVPTADGAVADNSTNHTHVFGSNGTTMVAAVAATGTGTATTCSSQVVTAVSGIAVPTCTTLTTAYAGANLTGTGNFVAATSPTLVTPALGAATATSLVATGNIDGKTNINTITTTPCTLGTSGTNCGANSFLSGYTINRNATPGTAIVLNLPTVAAGLQYCVANGSNATPAADTGTLQVIAAASNNIIFTDGTLSATAGYVISSGAGGDAACFVGQDTTSWILYVNRGSWTKH